MALVLATLVAPHLIGGIHAWATAVNAGIACAVLGLTLWATRDRPEGRGEPLATAMALAVIVTIVHALPLPASLAAAVAPEAHANAVEVAARLDLDPPRWIPFSLDPAGTWERVLYGVAVFATFCSARLLSLASGAKILATGVAGSTFLVALSHLGHQLANAKLVYGLYAPAYARPRGPLLNSNNFAGLMALGVPICLGLGLRKRGAERWAWFVGGGVLAATGLLAGSRAGFVVLIGGPILFGLAYGARRLRSHRAGSARPGQRRRQSSSLEAGLLVSAMLATGFGLAELAADDFLDTNYQDLTKLEMFATELRTLETTRTAILGVGRGAFRAAVSAVVREPIRMMHAECLPLQYAIEFGVPFAAVLILIGLMRLGVAFTRWHSPVQLGCIVGVVVLGLHNLIDFSLELTGIALPAAVAFGAGLPMSDRDDERSAAQPERKQALFALSKVATFGCVLSLLACLTASSPAATHDILVVEQKLGEYAKSSNREAFWNLYRDIASGHASDPSLALLGALQRTVENAPDATFWLNRSMRLSPASAFPHLWAAHWLASRGRWDQAENELKSAADLDPSAFMGELCSWMKSRPNVDFLMRVVPSSEPARRDSMNAAAVCLSGDAPAVSANIDTVLVQSAPGFLPPTLREARRTLARGGLREVVERMGELRRREPNSAAVFEIEAEALVALGDPRAAVALLSSALGRTDNNQMVLVGLATAEAKAGNAIGMRDAIARLRGMSAGRVNSLAQVMAHLSSCEATLGNDAQALKAMMEAYRLSQAPDYLANAAQLALKLGQKDFVLRAWTQLCDSHRKAYCPMRDKLEKEMVEGSLAP